MSIETSARAQMLDLATHLEARREAILSAWHEKAEADASLTTASSLSRVQFNDHIPEVLKGFERRLRMWRAEATPASRAQGQDAGKVEDNDAAEHGLHRWQQGYNLRELTAEWGHLQLCLSEELDEYQAAHPDAQREVLAAARRGTVHLCIEGISESVAQYARLQQAEAAGHARDLKESLEQLNELERHRAEMMREAAHDLRGNLSVVSGATSMLQRDNVPEPVREEFLSLLQDGVSSLQNMLNDLMDLARLEAGHETRKIAPFDAALLLNQLGAASQAMAQERDLYLRCEGPDELLVSGDEVKVRRIAQNLLLNALKYTIHGGVTLSWKERDAEHWALSVCDSGPGLSLGPAAPLAQSLQSATATSREIEAKAGELDPQDVPTPIEALPVEALQALHAGANSNDSNAAARPSTNGRWVQEPLAQDRRDQAREPGEGIGLSIVKRLCELLDAGLELDSQAGRGSTFCVVLPRFYDHNKNDPS